VLNRSERIPDLVTAGRPTVAVRVPAGKVARGLIDRSGQPIAAPSANRSNRISPTRAEHVISDLGGQIDVVIDSGPTTVGLESTVIDLTVDPPRLLRPGPISLHELERELPGRHVAVPAAGESVAQPSSPGQMPVHYAPATPSFHVASREELRAVRDSARVAVVSFGEESERLEIAVAWHKGLGSPAAAAARLYDVLHHCDALGVQSIIVVLPPDRPEWLAVRDRLLRATRPLPMQN
jgi:L-threonylcarbamoyladenylate synthase